MNKTRFIMITVVIQTLALIIYCNVVGAMDNDEYAFEFINTEPEIINVAHECYNKGEITEGQLKIVMTLSFHNVILDPRNWCESLAQKIEEY